MSRSASRSVVMGLIWLAACHPATYPSPGVTADSVVTVREGSSRPHVDGEIATLRPILATRRSEYFALTYWSGGLRVNGYLGRPRARASRLPAIVWNRGGNRDLGVLDARRLIPYVEAGFVAAGSQYRGGGGSEGKDSFGGEDVEDVLNLVTLLKRLPEVDPARIGMVGYSRGGMMTYRALREDARRGRNDLRVAATVGGLADLLHLDLRPDMLSVYMATIGCAPGGCPEEYRARSAVRWGGEIRAPLLLLHGEDDVRVDVEQSRRLADEMTRAGRPVKLVTYPGDDHELSAHEGGLPEILPWLGAHLGVPPETLTGEAVLPRAGEVYRAWPVPEPAEPHADVK
jgi:dipeptidyl aminopeptidase/acylaminoacyl peptidase